MSDVVDLLSRLVGIDSVNPGLVPGAAGEGRIVDDLRERLDRAGFATHVVMAGDGAHHRPSLVAAGPEVDGPTVVLNGHLDTVGVSGMAAPFEPRVDGGRLVGRGAADMKGGVAAMVVAAERLSAAGAALRPVLALVADEEDASLGSEAVVAALPGLGIGPDACIIGEPTDNVLARTLRGFGVVRVRFAGRAAHSSQPELGVNAVTHLGRLLHAVDAHPDLMATVARGGTSAFVVPDSAECVVEQRVPPGVPAAGALDLVEALLTPDLQATAELVAHREAWCLDEAGPAADLAARLGDALGTGATFDAPYWMEAPLWQAACPTLVCGPSGGGLHAVDEWVDLRQVEAYAEALVIVLGHWSPRAD
jgi:acetylornithine deacetylase